MNGQPSRCSWPRRTTTPPHGERRWPGAGGGYEVKRTAKFRWNPPPKSPARSTSSLTMTACRSSGARGRTDCLLCPGRVPLRTVPRETQTVEQLVDVPVPQTALLTLLAMGLWVFWWLPGTQHTSCQPLQDGPPAQGGIQNTGQG